MAAVLPVPPVHACRRGLAGAPAQGDWLGDLEREARRRLEGGEPEVWDALTRQFEGQLIHTALEITRGRRIEAAQRLGIGRNTITRKIQELGLDDCLVRSSGRVRCRRARCRSCRTAQRCRARSRP
jgi:two-component system nitrogen regulation response regulator GlnG